MRESHHSLPRDSSNESRTHLTYAAATAGLQKKLNSNEKDQRFQYHLISIVFNLIAIAQVTIGAAITALGPSAGEHMLAITILGAFNTIAGLSVLLKGAISLSYGNSHVSDDGIIILLQDVFLAYASAEQIIEENQPDTYTDVKKS
ncbi:hypothetical protein PENARI_c046G10062 [Penicillium arizonense]|uniref:SMODS and SLOG-associating 2TM effector domain-containing protein n=1 Tax=Penicillium arizonense TaxID=1835702 RepID=A0A1F5L381_PENAI|nr:hypothetical protein PENARI_c046G10062 [Penicillium arizonense]OGE47381.1 hypothetical protein PENARI_c046G10062 [Penicillium arizonense]